MTVAGEYDAIYRRSMQERDAFWAEAAEAISWSKSWDRILDDSRPPLYRWFPGAALNTCYNCVDRHVEAGRGDQVAIIHDSPVTNSKRLITFRELQDLTARFAGALAARGIGRGDRVILYMPMVPEAVVAMLGCARLGAVHSVVFGGFAPRELATRIEDSGAKAIVAASGGIEPGRIVHYKPMLDEAIAISGHKPDFCLILERDDIEHGDLVAGRDVDWNEAMAAASPHEPVPVSATDPLYILYTSGTTGQPKGVVRDNGGHAVALRWTMPNIYGVQPGETYWAASDVGWVVGHSYIVYGPLLNGNTTIVYEGKPVGTPDAGAFWRVIAEHKVVCLFTAPTAFRAIRKEDPEAKLIANYDLSQYRSLFLAGERCDPATLEWAQEKLKVPVVDHWWQTETGWTICGNPMGIEMLPVKPGSATRPMVGYDVQVVDEGCNPVPDGDIGAIVVKLPLPPGTFPTLWNAEQRYRDAYLTEFPGYYKTGDAGLKDSDGYIHVMTRTDDVINVAGHRLSTGAMEEVLASHPDVAECAVIGAADTLKGQLPLGFLVLKAGVNRPGDEIVKEVVGLVRERIGPVAAFRQAAVVARLPKTRSGKILRGTMQKIADGETYPMPATIDDPVILDEITDALKDIGYPEARQQG